MLTGDHAHFRELGLDYETNCRARHSGLSIRLYSFECAAVIMIGAAGAGSIVLPRSRPIKNVSEALHVNVIDDA
jgi:hypothetical protein